MRIAIRADASRDIGTGHVVRCLCLADELRERGATIAFVGDIPLYFARRIAEHGHTFIPMLGAASDEADDARSMLEAAGDSEWTVVDHYLLGRDWESVVRAGGSKILAIDDLARTHDCDVLLDQNFHPAPEQRYQRGVSGSCTMLLGPRYALLRSEFARMRLEVRAREGDVHRLLVFLGGGDSGNATEQVLEGLRLARLPAHVTVDVVIGEAYAARDRLLAMAASHKWIRCHVETARMADLLSQTDVAIGAGGSATWERCALGVPTLALCLADNQRDVLFHASRRGLVYAPDLGASVDPAALARHLHALLFNSGLRYLLSVTGMNLVDGLGVQRVIAEMLSDGIVMRRATHKDADIILGWRNDPAVRAVSRNTEAISPEQHRCWLANVLASPSRPLLIGERDGSPVGVVRFDAEDNSAEVSIYLVPSRIGRGEGVALLRAAESWLRCEYPAVRTLRAHVATSNPASQRMFERCGYLAESAEYAKRVGS